MKIHGLNVFLEARGRNVGAMRNLKFVLVEQNLSMLERLSKTLIKVKEFSLIGAFANLKSSESATKHMPDIILLDIDSDSIDEIMVVRQCKKMFPRSGIICISKKWEEKLAVILFKEGCKGYLVKPFDESELMRTVISLEKNGIDRLCSVSTFFGPKGKCGRTSLIANLALALSNKWDQNVAIIDADIQFSDMAVFFNVEPVSTIVEAARDVNFLTPVTLNDYFTPINDKLRVLCGTKSPEMAEYVNAEDLAKLINLARRMYQFVLIDVPPAFNAMSIGAMEESDNVFVVAMVNGTYEMENTRRSMEIFKVWEDFDQKVNTIFTRVWPYTEKEKSNLEKKLGYPVCLIVPNEYTLISSTVNSGVMAIEEEPESQFADSIGAFANRLCHRLGVR